MRNMPQLKRLEICDCDVVRDEVPPNTQPVSLPSLQFLRVEFNNKRGVLFATEQFLDHILAPPQCSLHISLANIDDEEDSIIGTFCEWLFGGPTKEVLEGVESFKLGFDISREGADRSLNFQLLSCSANVEGGISRYWSWDVQYVLEYIQGLFQRSRSSKSFTTLTLSRREADLLNDSQIIASLEELPPVTHLELIEPLWPSTSEDISNGLAPRTPSPFSTIKCLILREVPPKDMLEIVLGVLGDPQARVHPMSKCRVAYLDSVEVHVEQEEFDEVEAVAEILRNDPRIGKVDLYVAL
ncbi:hypothetical protein FS837_009073 [Tulasnella sp. UAMH 9824]|nr:hypothetical protein FS837_009073 [Tulasnella sp. UAMH 9824]